MQHWRFLRSRTFWVRAILAGLVASNAYVLVESIQVHLRTRQVVDPVTVVDSTLARMLDHLPPRGVIGYLKSEYDSSNAADLREFVRVQYALAPRILVPGTEPDFVVAVARAEMPPVPDGFVVETAFSGRVALYRRAR